GVHLDEMLRRGLALPRPSQPEPEAVMPPGRRAQRGGPPARTAYWRPGDGGLVSLIDESDLRWRCRQPPAVSGRRRFAKLHFEGVAPVHPDALARHSRAVNPGNVS